MNRTSRPALALVGEGKFALKDEAEVTTFVNWAQSIMESPRAIFGPCGNSEFGSKATRVDGGWKYVTTVDGRRNLAWNISCDADGIVTGVDRNLAGLPPGPTREENRAARMAEVKRREEVKAWWVAEWSAGPMTAEPDAAETRDGFRDIAFACLRSAETRPGREALEADPAFHPLKDDPRWKELLEALEK